MRNEFASLAQDVIYRMVYSVKQSDRDSSKTDIFHKPTTYREYVWTRSEQKKTFARHENGRVGVFRIKMRSFSSEVIASRKEPILQMFPSDCITL